jgi:histidinol dehydrogenase
VLKISGAQGVAALAFGTGSVPAVDKIVGPGHLYSQMAKKMLQGQIGIDSFAGPSEVAIITDEGTPDSYAAADLLSQAEHGSGFEASVVFCLSLEKAKKIKTAMEDLVKSNDLSGSVSEALRRYGNIFVVDSIETAVEAVNMMAPEHAEVLCEDAESVAEGITRAGAVFVGLYSPEPVGDYYCGTNHVLPTSGSARFSSGLGVQDFIRSYSVIRYTREALRDHASSIQTLADAEGMKAHNLSIEVRNVDSRKTEK